MRTNVINLSYHKPILTTIIYYDDFRVHKEINESDDIIFITLNPNLEIEEVKQKFNNILACEMEKYVNQEITFYFYFLLFFDNKIGL